MGKHTVYPTSDSYTWEEYLKLEAESDDRIEYQDGRIVPMAGANNRHNEIAGNCYVHLKKAGKESGCKSYFGDIKLFRNQSERYLYPDAMVTCNPLDLQTKNGVRSPSILVEVLSNSTRDWDRSFKLREYFKIPSLQHYLLIEQTHCEVQHYRRKEDLSWEILIYGEMEDQVDLPEINLTLSLAEIYDDIDFGPELDVAKEEAQLLEG